MKIHFLLSRIFVFVLVLCFISDQVEAMWHRLRRPGILTGLAVGGTYLYGKYTYNRMTTWESEKFLMLTKEGCASLSKVPTNYNDNHLSHAPSANEMKRHCDPYVPASISDAIRKKFLIDGIVELPFDQSVELGLVIKSLFCWEGELADSHHTFYFGTDMVPTWFFRSCVKPAQNSRLWMEAIELKEKVDARETPFRPYDTQGIPLQMLTPVEDPNVPIFSLFSSQRKSARIKNNVRNIVKIILQLNPMKEAEEVYQRVASIFQTYGSPKALVQVQIPKDAQEILFVNGENGVRINVILLGHQEQIEFLLKELTALADDVKNQGLSCSC